MPVIPMIVALWSAFNIPPPVRSATRGQGVIEYAGALVVAGVLISAMLTTNTTYMADVFTQTISVLGDYFVSQIEALAV